MGWKLKIIKHGNGQMAKNSTTGSTSQDLRTVHIWIVWESAAQPVERIYTRYAAKPLNNKETYLPLDYYNTNLRKFVLINAAPQSEIFHKDLVKKLCLILEIFFQTRLWKKEREIPGISAAWNTSPWAEKVTGLTDRYIQEWEEQL